VRPDRDWWAGTAFTFTTVRLGLVGLLGLVAVLVGGGLYRRVREEVAASPWQAVLIGLAAQVIFLPLLVVVCGALLFSIVGIPVLALVPVALMLFGIVWLLGFATVAQRVGERLLGGLPAPLGFLTGFVLLTALVWLARIGWWAGWLGLGTALALGIAGALVEGLAWSAGLGALILAWLRRAQPARAVTAPEAARA
jgi:hypothetical protein